MEDGINYYLSHQEDQYENCNGVITVDLDGQHHLDNIICTNGALADTTDKKVVLGCRDFDLNFIPFKSKFGNKLTRVVFRFCFGTDIRDTQTGIRDFSNALLPDLLELYGERFEYETNVLIECVKSDVKLEQITIQTIYENGNEGIHFDPIWDSIKIYRLILKRFFICCSFCFFIFNRLYSVLAALQIIVVFRYIKNICGNSRSENCIIVV